MARREIYRQGDFSLRMGAVIQVQGAFYVGDDAAPEAYDPATTEGFRVRRARFVFAGDLLRDVSYSLGVDLKDTVVAALGGDQGSEILEAVIRWTSRCLKVQVGLDKVPFSTFSLQSSSRLTLIERPLIVAALAPDYRVGAMIAAHFAGLRAIMGVYNGSEGVTSGNKMAGIAGVGRLEYELLPGALLSPGRNAVHLTLGGAYLWDDTPSVRFHRVSGSLDSRFRMVRLLGEFLWQYSSPKDVPEGTNQDSGVVRQWGAAGELSAYLYKRYVQLAARYEYFWANELLATYGRQQLVSGGLNLYFYDHFLKLQINYTRRHELEGPGIQNDIGFAQLQAMF